MKSVVPSVKDVFEAGWDTMGPPSVHAEVPTWKRVLDFVFILFTLPLVLPFFAIIAIGIKVVSRGPVFFKQERIGYRGRKFLCYKFRSMKVDADRGLHKDYLKELMRSDTAMIKMDKNGDSRLIPLGGLLRATGLDELPQLINVLRGEMSVVGPRPCTEYEFEDYAPWQMERFNTLPGLTGLWQVSGKNRTTFSQMINLDIAYARNKTPWMDLAIMFKTVPALAVQVWETKVAGNNGKPAGGRLATGSQAVRRTAAPERREAQLVGAERRQLWF